MPQDAETSRSATQLAEELRLVIGRLARRLRQQTLGDLTPSQRSVLITLEQGGPMRMGELARIENVSAPSITGIVGRLEERRLAARIPDPADARSTLVQVTDEARRVMADARRQSSIFLAERLGRLDLAERATLAEAVPLLSRLIDG